MSLLSSGILLLSCVLSFLAGLVACRIGTKHWSRADAADGEASPETPGRGAEVDRLRGVARSLPGIEFQYHVEPGGDGHYRFVGARAEELLGLSPQADDFEEQFLQRVPEAYRDRHNRCTRAARDGEPPEQVELPFDRPGGERIWLLLTSMLEHRPAPDGGETLVFTGFMLDVTERKQQERTLRILSETVKQTTDGVLITEAPDPSSDDEPGDGSIVYANRAFEEMTGYDEDELVGRTPEIFRGPDTDPEVIADLRRSRAAEEPWEGETVNYRSDGRQYISRWSTAPVTDEDGDVRYWVSIQRDVTEKRRREQALRRQQALLEQAQRLTGAWMADLRTGEVSWSEEGYRIHELDPNVELTLEKGFEFLAPEAQPEVREAFERCVETGEPYDLEHPIVTAEGTRRWVRTVGGPVGTEDGEVVKVAGAFQDITERKRRERRLETVNTRLTLALESTNTGTFDWDMETGAVRWDETSERLFGFEPGSFPNSYEGWADRIHPDDLPTAERNIERAIETGDVYDVEFRVRRPDGEQRWIRSRGTVKYDDDGNPVRMVGIHTDLTGQKRREQALERQNDLFERAQEIADIGAWEYDLTSGEATWTGKAYRIVGLPPDADNSPEETFALYHEEDRPKIEAAFQEAVEQGTAFDVEARLAPTNGEPRWVRARGEPQVEDGAVVRVRGTIQDITEQKRRVQELTRYERLIENLPVGVFRTTESGEFVDMNETLTELFGVSEDHFRRAGSEAMYANPEDRAALLEVLRQEGKVEGELFRMQTQNGGERWTRATITLTEENGERYLEGIIEDVTERRRVEQALQKRERRFRALFEEHSAPMLLVDPETGAIERANAAASAFYGYDDRRLTSMTVQDLNVLPAEEVAARRADAKQRAQNRFVFPHQLESGEVRMVEVHSTPVTIDDQSLLFSIIHDVTERKEKEREARLRSDAIEASTDGIAIIDADGTYLYVNEAHAEAYGYEDPDAMLGRSWRICYGEAELARFDEEILPRLHEEGTWRGEATGQTTDGASFPQELTLTTFGGGVTISVVRDITEQKRREAVLRERQEKIEALYEATRRLLRAESREEIVDEIHGVLRDVFTYPFRHTAFVEEDTIIPNNTTTEGEADLPRPVPRPVDGDTVAARALAAGEAVVVPDTRTLDNGIDYGDLRAAAGVPIGRRGVIIVGKDTEGDFDRLNLHLLEVLGGYTALVLERLRRERALRVAKEGAEAARAEAEAARDEARKAARLKSAFLANMSHEIRTPLTSIIGFAEVLGTEISDLDAPVSGALEQKVQLIQEGGNRLLDTLEGVLNLSKLEAGQMELDRHPVDLAAQARRTAEELRPKADDEAIDLQVQAANPLPQAQADEGGVQIVIQNLLSNAIKYTEAGGDVWVRTYPDDEAVVLEVEDTGIGMEPERAEELFEPFRQASEGMGRQYEGSGVGLAVTRRAAEEMGGRVEVETEKGEGSRFVVRLPRAEASASEQASVNREAA